MRFVLDSRGSRRSPSRRCSLPAITRRVNGAGKFDLPAIGADVDSLGIEPRTMQSDADVVTDIGRVDARLDRRLVRHADDAVQPTDHSLGGIFLVVPGDFTGERDPALFDLDLDGITRNRDFPSEPIDRCVSDILVAAFGGECEADFELQGNGFHALHPRSRLLGRLLFVISRHMTGQRDNAIACHNADMRCSDAGLPKKFGENSFLKLTILRHKSS
jgi:hypothetical protein